MKLSGISVQTYVSVGVIGIVLCTALVRSSPPRVTPVLRRPTDEQAHDFYTEAAHAEVEARRKAVGRFRGSPWSQDDEFHAKEAKFVREYAKSHKLSMGSLIDTLDRGMHEGWSTSPNAPPDLKVLPCRPRLNY